jgi:HEXXH motif-containing protein
LIAYHAFGNVLLFYRMARARALPADQDGLDIAKRMKQLEQQLETLEKALQTTTALTPLGRALWEPLYERIHD